MTKKIKKLTTTRAIISDCTGGAAAGKCCTVIFAFGPAHGLHNLSTGIPTRRVCCTCACIPMSVCIYLYVLYGIQGVRRIANIDSHRCYTTGMDVAASVVFDSEWNYFTFIFVRLCTRSIKPKYSQKNRHRKLQIQGGKNQLLADLLLSIKSRALRLSRVNPRKKISIYHEREPIYVLSQIYSLC